MNRYSAPSTLDAKLLEEGRCHDALGLDEGVGVEEGAAYDAHHDDCEATAKDLTRPTAERAAKDGAKVGDDLGYGDGVLGEVVLFLEHGRVEVLRAVRLGTLASMYEDPQGGVYHEIKSSQQQYKVSQDKPMPLDSHLSLFEERRSHSSHLSSSFLSSSERLRLGKKQTIQNDQHWNGGRKPIKRSPSMRGCIDQGTRKRCRQQISKRISLLKNARDNPTSLQGTILKGGSCGIAVYATHGNTEESSTGQELLVGLAETGTQLEDNKQNIVDDKGPFAAPSV